MSIYWCIICEIKSEALCLVYSSSWVFFIITYIFFLLWIYSAVSAASTVSDDGQSDHYAESINSPHSFCPSSSLVARSHHGDSRSSSQVADCKWVCISAVAMTIAVQTRPGLCPPAETPTWDSKWTCCVTTKNESRMFLKIEMLQFFLNLNSVESGRKKHESAALFGIRHIILVDKMFPDFLLLKYLPSNIKLHFSWTTIGPVMFLL